MATLVVKHVKIEPDGKIVNDSEQEMLPGHNLARHLQAKKQFRADSIVSINSPLTYCVKYSREDKRCKSTCW